MSLASLPLGRVGVHGIYRSQPGGVLAFRMPSTDVIGGVALSLDNVTALGGKRKSEEKEEEGKDGEDKPMKVHIKLHHY